MEQEIMEQQKQEEMIPGAEPETIQQQPEQGPGSETEKVYTEADFNQAVNDRVNDLLSKKLGRKEAKIRKEYEGRYGRLESVLRAGTGKDDLNEIADDFEGFYRERGVQIPQVQRQFSDRETAILAKAEADEIIGAGDTEDELNRLALLGDRLSDKDKQIRSHLLNHKKNAERTSALAMIGADANDKEFLSFADKFTDSVPLAEVYQIYQNTKPKKDITPPGSVKSADSKDDSVKDFYTRDEAMKFSRQDFDKNPALFASVRKSMQKW